MWSDNFKAAFSLYLEADYESCMKICKRELKSLVNSNRKVESHSKERLLSHLRYRSLMTFATVQNILNEGICLHVQHLTANIVYSMLKSNRRLFMIFKKHKDELSLTLDEKNELVYLEEETVFKMGIILCIYLDKPYEADKIFEECSLHVNSDQELVEDYRTIAQQRCVAKYLQKRHVSESVLHAGLIFANE